MSFSLTITTIDVCQICRATNLLGVSESGECADCFRDGCREEIKNPGWPYEDPEWQDSMERQARECLASFEQALNAHTGR